MSTETFLLKAERPYLTPDATDAELQQATAAMRAFAAALYQALRSGEENLALSPYSIAVALTMALAGADGRTRQEMTETLHVQLPPERRHVALNALTRSLAMREDPNTGLQLNVANALWTQEGFGFLPAFLDLLAAQYDTGLHVVNFVRETEAARLAINAWVAEATQDKIRDLIPSGALTTLTRLVITNAIYFRGQWMHPFNAERTHAADFTRLDGERVPVDMMHNQARLRYAASEGCQVAMLPYQGTGVEMVVVLPADGRFRDIEKDLDDTFLQDLLERAEARPVDLFMPRFRATSWFDLSGALSALGMSDAFSVERADFSRMTGQRDLYISRVLHQAFVAVDELGTEAAAATAVIMAMRSMPVPAEPVELRLERPFLFFIRERHTNTLLFSGRVMDPRSR